MRNRIGILFAAFFLSLPMAKAQAPQLTSAPDAWPREYAGANGTKLSLYQPQFEKWTNYSAIEARVAAAFAPLGAKAPVMGVFTVTGNTNYDPETRKVKIADLKLTELNFPTLDLKLLPDLGKTFQALFPPEGIVVSVDRILVSLERNQPQSITVALKNDAPPIFFSQKPALLVNVDGDPIWSPIPGTDLKYAVNTNWDLFQDSASTLYLRNGETWMKAANLNGPWVAAGALPADFSKLPADSDNWKEVAANVPGKPIPDGQAPLVFVSKTPAELIVTRGPPAMEAIPGTRLSYVANTNSELFFYAPDQNYYFLTSGRWFKGKGGNSTWSYVTDSLPSDFKLIPPNGPKGSVLASIPGTRESEEALIQAEIPVKAKVKRSQAKASASYAGEPKFEKISGTNLQYAVNTSSQVILASGKYYLVKDGVWFVSNSAQGPWVVADQVPPEIYSIPPSSPVYNVTYVKVYESDPEYVTTGYTAGYLGAFVLGTTLGATLVYGTGWYYPPYYYGAWYYPHPYTYGMAAYYNPWTGGFWRYGTYYGPYYGVGYGAAYNPATGFYSRGAAVYGPYGGYRAGAQAYNPWTNTYAATRQGSNGYSNWGSSVVERNDDWARTAHYSNGTNGAVGYQTANGNQGFVAKDNGDVYAGRDGNVYRKTDDGWQKYDNGSWNNVNGPKENGKSLSSTQGNLASSQGNKGNFQERAQESGLNRQSLGEKSGQQGMDRSSWQGGSRGNSELFQGVGDSGSNRDLGQQLNRDFMNRDRGNQRVSGFQNFQNLGDSRFGGGGFGGRGGGLGGGGFRGGGFRR